MWVVETVPKIKYLAAALYISDSNRDQKLEHVVLIGLEVLIIHSRRQW